METPIILGPDKIKRMNIGEDASLYEQIFWLSTVKCLRPMLAPNLYEIMRDIRKITHGPVKIFEVGSWLQKRKSGCTSMNEFTMLNLVELASVKEGMQIERLQQLAKGAMKAAGIDNYRLEYEDSGIYIETLDIVADGWKSHPARTASTGFKLGRARHWWESA